MGCNYGTTTVGMKNERRFKTWGGGGADGPKSKQQELHSRIEVFFFLFQGGKSFSCAMTHKLGWCGSRGFRGLSTAPRSPLLHRRSDPLSFPFVFVPFKEEVIAP
jgi:hypothetical protein